LFILRKETKRDGKRDSKFKSNKGMIFRKKFCRLCKDKSGKVDYKDTKLLEKFINDRGKIISCRISGNCAKHQRSLSHAIKRARFLAILPYTR
jgi:small subunit ribosomal protein S18